MSCKRPFDLFLSFTISSCANANILQISGKRLCWYQFFQCEVALTKFPKSNHARFNFFYVFFTMPHHINKSQFFRYCRGCWFFVFSLVDQEGDDAFICWYWNRMQWVLFDSFISPGNIFTGKKKELVFKQYRCSDSWETKLYHKSSQRFTKLQFSTVLILY